MVSTEKCVSPAGFGESSTFYLRQPEVVARVGVSWATIRRWEDKGLFPRRRRLGPNTVAWKESEIEEWCANRVLADEVAAA